jgi:hypothetical protein
VVVQLGPHGKERIVSENTRLADLQNPIGLERFPDEQRALTEGEFWRIVRGAGMDFVFRIIGGEVFRDTRRRLEALDGLLGNARFAVEERVVRDDDVLADLLLNFAGELRVVLEE